MVRANETYLVCQPHPDFTREQACDARAEAWSYIFGCYQADKETIISSVRCPNDAERRSDEIGATASTQRTA